jgi:hypothetical protein
VAAFIAISAASYGKPAGASDNLKDMWTAESFGKTVRMEQGKLKLVPPDEPWRSADLLGQEPILFWNKQGMTVNMTFTMEVKAPPGGQYDGIAVVGITPANEAGPVQQAANVAGLFIVWNQKESAYLAYLIRKEAQSSNAEARGNEWGDPSGISAPTPLKIQGNKLSVTFKIDEMAMSASVAGTGFSQSVATTERLTEKFWQNPAHLIVECRNGEAGRAAMTIESISMDCPRLIADQVQCLDLRPFANMAFRDEVKDGRHTGWTGQDENDLRNMPVGMQKLGQIPFDVINPDSNSGKSCVMLYSPAKDIFPKSAGPIAVGRKADSLIFLHSAAWATKPDVTAALYRAEYDDGSVMEIPIVVGAQIAEWWSLNAVTDPAACLAMTVKNEGSAAGIVGIYAYRWKNPRPEQAIRSLTLASAENEPVVGVIAVTLVASGLSDVQEALLKSTFARHDEIDLRRNTPDKDRIPDTILVKVPKAMDNEAFSAAGNYSGGDGGIEAMLKPNFAKSVNEIGGILRYPHGLEISFAFWPYESKDWYPALIEKGGQYGDIQRWVSDGGRDHVLPALSLQSMLAACQKQGLRIILQLHCTGMFDGKDFIYMKTLPEEQMRKKSPLMDGQFSQENLDKIVASNATLVDYVLANGYKDTVAYWEMDNERWDMPGADYAAACAAHIKMLHSKIPDAKTIVCIAAPGSYCLDFGSTFYGKWNGDLLSKLKDMHMIGQVTSFAPHEYPFLRDSSKEIVQNWLEDYCIRNVYRDLDIDSAMLDEYGFTSSKLYCTEWGAQSDGVCCEEARNDLHTCMAAALAAAKMEMAMYSHPRVVGATLHPFLHVSMVHREKKMPLSMWGEQTLFYTKDGRQVTTPHLEAVKMFVQFARGATLVPGNLKLPAGVNCIYAQDKDGTKYFAVNSTASSVTFPAKNPTKRSSLFSKNVLDTSILKYGSYADQPGEVNEILPQEFTDNVLPPFSISILR